MKKLFVTMLAILATGAAYALPVGNPSEASLLRDGLIWEGNCADPCDPCLSWCDAFSFRAGFYGDYVFNRHMEVKNSDVALDHPDIEHVSLYTNAGYLVLNAWDRVDFFATLGATNLFVNTNASAFDLGDGSRFDLETVTHFSWSVGGRATVWECGCTSLGIEGQYFRVNPRIKRITLGSDTSIYPDDVSTNNRYSEWQVGLGVSHRINMFVPYVAVTYSRPFWELAAIDGDDFDFPATDFRGKKPWAWALGVSLVDCEKAALTVEGRFGGEKAVYVNGQIRF